MTEPKAALAGVLLATSFAILRTSMNPFNVEMTPSLPVGGWDLASIVETRNSCGGTVEDEVCEEDPES